MDTDKNFVDLRLLDVDSSSPSVRYSSGLNHYQESLVDGRWISSTISTVGIPDDSPMLWGDINDNISFELEVDGQSLHRGWQWDSVKQTEKPNGSLEVVVKLKSTIRPISLYVHTLLDATAIMTRWLEIENTGDSVSALSSVSPWSGRIFPTQGGTVEMKHRTCVFSPPRGPFSIGYFAQDKPFKEGDFRWQPIDNKTITIGQDIGRSGWGHPIAYFRDRTGLISVLQLGWSGNWSIKVKPSDYLRTDFGTNEKIDLLFASVRVDGFSPQRLIKAGEIVKTPEVHFGTITGDISDMTRRLHSHQRKSVLPAHPKGKANLISYNHGGYDLIKNMTYKNLKREIDIAAELGAEVFTIDAAWNGNDQQHWMESTGDWIPGNRLPDGLEPIYKYARSKGLLCGLWCWIEAANLKSNLIKEHPDWLLSRDGRSLDNLLDLSKPEVADWVEDEIGRIVTDYGIDLFRIDYNVHPGEGGYNSKDGFDEGTIWRHYENFYGILERIRKRFPGLVLENCAGGGGRTDLGMMSRTHFTWLSDNCVVPHSVRLLNSALLTLAPQSTARYFGAAMNGHWTGDLQTQLRANFMCGNPCIAGLWPQQEDKNPILRDTVQNYVKLFKKHIRPMIAEGTVYNQTPVLSGSQPSGWCVLEYGSAARDKSVIAVFKLDSDSETGQMIKPRGLDIDGDYVVYTDSSKKKFTCSGWDIVNKGIAVCLSSALLSELLIIEKK